MNLDLDKMHYDELTTRHGPQGPGQMSATTYKLHVATHYYHIFEFYLPEALWAKGAMAQFVNRVKTLVPGSTTFHNAEGQWNESSEEVRVYRLSIEITDDHKTSIFDPNNLREAIRNTCEQLIVGLQIKDGHEEEAIFFNDWPAAGTLVRRLT